MKKVIGFAAVFALFAATQAFAIIGVGAHYVTNTGSLKGDSRESLKSTSIIDVEMEQKSASGLQGLGFKLWIDILPIIDIEGTFNFAATRYESSLYIVNKVTGDETEIPLAYSPDAPYNMLFDEALSPIFGVLSGDVSITYPFDILPIIRPYVGAGVSYIGSIPIVNKSFAKGIVENANIEDPNADVGTAVIDAFKKADYNGGFGCHFIAGVRVKPPIIPIAAYANVKYYLGGDTGSQFSQGAVFELGGGFAL